MSKKSSNQSGFSLVEIILAISVFALSVLGLSGGLIYGSQSNIAAANRVQATFLSSEGLEAVENIAEENFDNLVDGSTGLTVENNSYILTGNSDTYDIYERQITILSVDANTKEVTSRVSWSQGVMDEGEVTLSTYITDWK